MAANKLELKDLKFVRQELHGVKEKWLDIGMELGSSPTDLRKLAETHKQDYSNCLNLMLMQWLESGDASWKILCEALKSSMVDETTLSTQLQEKYCKEKSTSKSVKRGHPDDGTAPKAKRSKGPPLPTSFPPEDFLRFQPPNRICYMCNQIPRTPLHPECCSSKLYCEPCSQEVKICSTHRTEIKFKRDDEQFIAVPKLKIKCPNWKEGCEFKETVSKVYRDHLPHCTKAKTVSVHAGIEHTDTPKVTSDPGVNNDPGGTAKKTDKPGSKSTDGRKPSSEAAVEEVWYVACEDPHTTPTISPVAPPSNATVKTLLSQNNTVSSSPPAKNPKPGVPAVSGGKPPPSTPQQHTAPKPSANVAQNPLVQQLPKPSGDSATIPVQQQQQQQVVYDVKQLMSTIQQLPVGQNVWCLHKASGCTWKGLGVQLIQHLTLCQYSQKSTPTKVKTEIKQEPQVLQVPPATTLPAVHQPVVMQQAQNIKQEPSSPQISFGSQIGHQAVHIKKEPSSPSVAVGSDKNQNKEPCQYKAIGCKKMVTKGKMKEHLQESVQHHLDLAIKRIMQNEAKK